MQFVPGCSVCFMISVCRDVGSISNLGGRHFEGTFSVRKMGHFLKIKRALLCLLQSLGEHVPPVPPIPTSMSVGVKNTLRMRLA